MKQNILVIGSTGTVGTEIVKNLKAQGHVVRETTSKASELPHKLHLNLLTGEGRNEIFKNIDRAFLLSPAGYTNQDEILIPLIEEAKKNKLQKIVLMTAMGANANPEAPLRKAEVALESSGLSYNIIRPNWFLQNFNTFWLGDILTQNKILLPAGDAKTSFIDARDIAAVATQLLVDDQLKNQDFELTGSEAFTHAEVAQVLSSVTNKEISYQEITPETFKSNLLRVGVPNDYADFLNLIIGYLKQGYSSKVTDSVTKITGKKPMSLQQYAQDYKSRWI